MTNLSSKDEYICQIRHWDIVNLYYWLFINCPDPFNSAFYSPLYDRLSLQVVDDCAVPWDSLLYVIYDVSHTVGHERKMGCLSIVKAHNDPQQYSSAITGTYYMECQKPKKIENISLPAFYMVIHFLYCISINIFKFLVDYLYAIHIFILH